MQGRTGAALEKTSILVFLFNGEAPEAESLATIRIEVTSLASVYVQTKAGI